MADQEEDKVFLQKQVQRALTNALHFAAANRYLVGGDRLEPRRAGLLAVAAHLRANDENYHPVYRERKAKELEEFSKRCDLPKTIAEMYAERCTDSWTPEKEKEFVAIRSAFDTLPSDN